MSPCTWRANCATTATCAAAGSGAGPGGHPGARSVLRGRGTGRGCDSQRVARAARRTAPGCAPVTSSWDFEGRASEATRSSTGNRCSDPPRNLEIEVWRRGAIIQLALQPRRWSAEPEADGPPPAARRFRAALRPGRRGIECSAALGARLARRWHRRARDQGSIPRGGSAGRRRDPGGQRCDDRERGCVRCRACQDRRRATHSASVQRGGVWATSSCSPTKESRRVTCVRRPFDVVLDVHQFAEQAFVTLHTACQRRPCSAHRHAL
jgi:hypothetical protein